MKRGKAFWWIVGGAAGVALLFAALFMLSLIGSTTSEFAAAPMAAAPEPSPPPTAASTQPVSPPRPSAPAPVHHAPPPASAYQPQDLAAAEQLRRAVQGDQAEQGQSAEIQEEEAAGSSQGDRSSPGAEAPESGGAAADDDMAGAEPPGAAPSNQVVLPAFSWPPPAPSEKMNLPRAKLVAGFGANPDLAEVGSRLTEALERAGYSEYSYFSVPGGFALVARLEQITADGAPEPNGVRFLDPDSSAPFSLSAYIKRLFFAPDGYYRLIAFVVTDRAFVAKGKTPTAAAAEAWLREGADQLPSQYYEMPFTRAHEVTALIYEFRKQGDRNVSTLVPGHLDARTHLEKAGLTALLAGAAP